MRKFRGSVTIGLVRARRDFEFEMEDDASEADIEAAAQDEMYNIVDWHYTEVTDAN